MTVGNAESILKGEDEARIRDYLLRDGWSEFTIRETFATLEDEAAIDPEGGAFLLECHLEVARKAGH